MRQEIFDGNRAWRRNGFIERSVGIAFRSMDGIVCSFSTLNPAADCPPANTWAVARAVSALL
jgi:hypothetical protein